MAEKIVYTSDGITVPDNPRIPYIEGDGIGPEIWAAASRVIDAAVQHAYRGNRKIAWLECFAGQKAFDTYGSFLPDETISTMKEHVVSIKGPLTTPVGGGMRSLNVALRKTLDLYVCLRPVKYYSGIPAPVVRPQAVDMVVFRENTEDVYAGYECREGSPEALDLIRFFRESAGWDIPLDAGIGIKPITEKASKRLVRAALQYALDKGRKSVTLVHKGNIMKYTEGAFRQWGYDVAAEEFPGSFVLKAGSDGTVPKGKVLLNDVIADAFFERIITRPEEVDVIATMNLNGDYISDALAALVGGIGIAPGANINYAEGTAVFEATHGTAPAIAGTGKANPGSLILSGRLMLEYMGWNEAAAAIERGISGAIGEKKVTFDFHRLMDEAVLVSTAEFADQVIKNMN